MITNKDIIQQAQSLTDSYIKEAKDLCATFVKTLNSLTEKVKPVGRWKPESGDFCFFYNPLGNKVSHMECRDYVIFKDLIRTGNCFKTKEEAQAYKERLILLQEVEDYVNEINEGWEPDWSNHDQDKHYITYDYKTHTYFIDYNRYLMRAKYCFPSNSHAQKLIDKYGLDLIEKRLIF